MASKKGSSGFWDRLKSLIIKPLSGFGKTNPRESNTEAEKAEERARQQQRKRDEFVRRRELESLRKVRDNNKDGASANDFEAPPSTTSPNTDLSQREATLRKINEIERMMSVDVKGQPKRTDEEAKARAFQNTQPMQMNPPVRPAVPSTPRPSPPAPLPASGFQSTEVMDPKARPPAKPLAKPPVSNSKQPPSNDFMLSQPMMGFLPSASAMAMEVQEVSHDPVLEEAAIHFANAEYSAAEHALKAAIGKDGVNHRNQETWRALFDLYRATGDQMAFESVGLDFVDVFEMSAPNWYNMNDNMGAGKAAPSTAAAPAAYTCQPKVDTWAASQTAQFIESKLMSGGVVAIDFSKVNMVDPAAAELLSLSFASLARANAQAVFTGSRSLQRALIAITVANDSSVPKGAWALRLELLRLLGNHDEFENVALDYTLTYEVSPPAWLPAVCTVSHSEVQELSLVPTEESPDSNYGPATNNRAGLDSRLSNLQNAAIEGEIVGGNNVISASMERAAKSDPVVVNCARLKRIDFASAGMLLNWVLELEAEGKAVIMTDAHRLVAAFFNVIGISGHAKVSLRKD